MTALRSLLRARGIDIVLAVVLASGTLLVHNVNYLLTTPYWVDEAWVAVQNRFPVSNLPDLTSSTPIGWSFLIRLVPGHGEQRARLVPLIFAALAVIAAYGFASSLPWRARWISILAGASAGAATLLAQPMLIRDDLKQYTADACLGLVVLLLVARLEREWSRGRLAALAGVTGAGMLLSIAAGFVGVAAFVALAIVTAARRERAELIEVGVAGAVAAAGIGIVYAAFYSRSVVPGLTAFWRGYYIPRNLHAVSFIRDRTGSTLASLGLGPAWLALLLILLGLVAVVHLGQPILAATVLVLWFEMIGLAATDHYPFLDERTSTFLTVIAVVLAAIGIVAIASSLPGWFGLIALPVCLLAAGFYLNNVSSAIRSQVIPAEGMRAPVRYVEAHRQPGDIVLVNFSSNWGFGYYWKPDPPTRQPDQNDLQGYLVTYPASTGVIVASDRTPAVVEAALDGALALAAQRHGRIWLVRTHVSKPELAAWNAAFKSVDKKPVTLLYPPGPRNAFSVPSLGLITL